MNKEEVMKYLRNALDKYLEQNMREKLGKFTYRDTYSIRCDVKEFEQVMEYIEENLK